MSCVGCPRIWFADQAGAFIKIAKEGTYTTMGKEGISLQSFDIHFCQVSKLKNDVKKLQKERKEDTQSERKHCTVDTGNQGSRY